MLMTGIFAENVGLITGHTQTFYAHVLALVLVSAYCFFGSYALYYLVNRIIPMRVSVEEEEAGLDLSMHHEKATDF